MPAEPSACTPAVPNAPIWAADSAPIWSEPSAATSLVVRCDSWVAVRLLIWNVCNTPIWLVVSPTMAETSSEPSCPVVSERTCAVASPCNWAELSAAIAALLRETIAEDWIASSWLVFKPLMSAAVRAATSAVPNAANCDVVSACTWAAVIDEMIDTMIRLVLLIVQRHTCHPVVPKNGPRSLPAPRLAYRTNTLGQPEHDSKARADDRSVIGSNSADFRKAFRTFRTSRHRRGAGYTREKPAPVSPRSAAAPVPATEQRCRPPHPFFLSSFRRTSARCCWSARSRRSRRRRVRFPMKSSWSPTSGIPPTTRCAAGCSGRTTSRSSATASAARRRAAISASTSRPAAT